MTFFIDFHDRHFAAVLGDRLAVIEDGVVLDRSGHDVASIRRHLERGMERGVVRFRPAARENDFVRLATEQGRDPLVRQLGRVFHLRAEAMRARGIPVLRGQERHHFLEHFRVDPGAGIIIEINNLSSVLMRFGVRDSGPVYSGGRGSFPGCCAW